MTASIGGLALSDDLILSGPINQARVATKTRATLGGRTVVTAVPQATGRLLVLSTYRGSGGSAGTVTMTQAEQLAAWRDAASEVELVHHRGTFRVVILGLELEPINGVADPGASTLMVGAVTMIEV
jgi:hypothetical protein